MPGSFFDTNILLYMASADFAKAERTEKIVAEGGTISVQVLNEIANVARRKMQMRWAELHVFLSALRGLLTVEPISGAVHDTGLALAERHNLSIDDAMIAASALHAGCETLWSEDMQEGMVLDRRLRIANPFHNV